MGDYSLYDMYRCIGLQEIRFVNWAKGFRIGREYKMVDKDDKSLLLEDEYGNPMWVDPSQFEKI